LCLGITGGLVEDIKKFFIIPDNPEGQVHGSIELILRFGSDHIELTGFQVYFALTQFHSVLKTVVNGFLQIDRYRLGFHIGDHQDIFKEIHPEIHFQVILGIFKGNLAVLNGRICLGKV